MRVDQAVFGNTKHGFALRCASGDQKFAAELAQRLDLPDTEPPGSDWSPVTSGFQVGDRYVIARMFRDLTAERAGMVVTHALVCDLDEIEVVDNLQPLVENLQTSFDAMPTAVEALELNFGSGEPNVTPDLVDTARALVSRGTGPVVRIGTEGFEELIVALWARLWPSLRRSFYFRLSFGPRDVADTPAPTIVCTPEALRGRWQQKRIVGQCGDDQSQAAWMLAGSDDGAELRAFGDRIGASLDSFQDLRLLEQACALLVRTPDVVSGLISAARLIERLSSDPQIGVVEKRSIVDRLVRVFPDAQPSDILALRNLPFSSYDTGDLVWQAMTSWFERNQFSSRDDADLVAIISDAFADENAVAPWREAAKKGLEQSSSATGGRFAAGFWRWASAEPSLVSPLIALVSNDRRRLDTLEIAAPRSIDTRAAKLIMTLAAKKGLFRLHAIAAGASMKPAEAARIQSALEPGQDSGAMQLAMRRATPSEILDVVESVPDVRVLAIAGERVAKDPSLLVTRDMTMACNRRIWVAALRIDPKSWRGPEDPQMAFEGLLEEQISGNSPPADLLYQLSGTPLADISTYPRRAEVWRNLSQTTRERLLMGTADAWFQSVGSVEPKDMIEIELAEWILKDPRFNELMQRLQAGRIAEGLDVINSLGGLDDAWFRQWVFDAVRANNPIAGTDADLLGRTLSSRGLHNAVDDLISIYRAGRKDIEPALRQCIGLVGVFDRLLLGISPPSSDEKWVMLIELAAELLPNGPDQDSLWERAGGRSADLLNHGTGQERWRHAVRAVQSGKSPRAPKLIQQLQADFPGNHKLRLLAADPQFQDQVNLRSSLWRW